MVVGYNLRYLFIFLNLIVWNSDNWVDTWSKAAVKKDLVTVKITTSLHGPKERLERPTQFPILRLNLRDSTLRSF